MVLTFGMHEYDNFTVFLLNILCSLWLAGKDFCSMSLNCLPMLVLTPASKGGLNHVMFLVLFLFGWFSFAGA